MVNICFVDCSLLLYQSFLNISGGPQNWVQDINYFLGKMALQDVKLIQNPPTKQTPPFSLLGSLMRLQLILYVNKTRFSCTDKTVGFKRNQLAKHVLPLYIKYNTFLTCEDLRTISLFLYLFNPTKFSDQHKYCLALHC